MKQKDKELLLKDLCARLPYGLMCECGIEGKIRPLYGIAPTQYYVVTLDNAIDGTNGLRYSTLEECKPYLRSMSSMTEKEFDKYEKLEEAGDFEHLSLPLLDWFLKNHFDYRGLIEKGLAIEVTEENNPYNTAFKIVC